MQVYGQSQRCTQLPAADSRDTYRIPQGASGYFPKSVRYGPRTYAIATYLDTVDTEGNVATKEGELKKLAKGDILKPLRRSYTMGHLEIDP